MIQVGQRFGSWTVIEMLPERAKDRQIIWLCRCDCGIEKSFRGGWLKDKLVRPSRLDSCRECRAKYTSHPLWRRWYNMIDRCDDPTSPGYVHYGARGIKVCERWYSFENFLVDMEPTFRPGLQIDREDNNKGYEPDNCRWVTVKINRNNTRTTVFLRTPDNQQMTISEAAEKYQIDRKQLSWFTREKGKSWKGFSRI